MAVRISSGVRLMNEMGSSITFSAFAGSSCVASGSLASVAAAAKVLIDGGELRTILIFDDASAEVVEVDFRGSADDVLSRVGQTADQKVASSAQKGPGRPKLGVVAREVTLLPRHWDWLNSQPGGASVALRKLVEEARRTKAGADVIRRSQESAYRFMSAMAGNQCGFEEAARSLFASDRTGFEESIEGWPVDVREYSKKLAAAAWKADCF